jgi:hypothetical protein
MLKGVGMAKCRSRPRALFLFPDTEPKPDIEICSGIFPSHLNGKRCPYSYYGRMPPYIESGSEPIFDTDFTDAAISDHQSCMLQKVGRVDQWQRAVPLKYPEECAQKVLYKCRQMFLLVLMY